MLDVGTGTGIWAIDFADAHPDAEVIGTDISPIQPSWIPPNLQFQIDDCTQDWTFPPNTFDYVHMRYLVGSIADWHALFAQAFAALAPGGHLESLEGSPSMESDDGTVDPRSAMGQWGRFFLEGGRATGRSFAVVADGVQRAAMEAAGFVDVQEWDYKVPIGPWPRDRRLRELGSVAQLTLQEDEEGYVLFMANVLAGWSREQIHVYIAHLRRQLRAGKSHAYFRLKAVWGRKPEVETGGN